MKASLNGERGAVELRDNLGRFGKLITPERAKVMMQEKIESLMPVATLYKILKSFSKEEKEELNSVLKVGKMDTPLARKELIAYNYENDPDSLESSDKGYEKFIKFLEQNSTRLHINYLEKRLSSHDKEYISDDQFASWLALNEEVADVGAGYMVTRKLAPILKDLLSKHKDICLDSTLSPKVKTYLFNMLCECIHGMRSYIVGNITEELLLNWWGCLKVLKFARFSVEFVSDRLLRIARAYFGIRVTGKVTDVTDELNKEIAELQKKIGMLEQKRDRIASEKSKNVDECIKEAVVLKLDKAAGIRLL